MIENSYSLNLSTKEAQKNVDELNKSFELQADLVDKLEKELQDYESELKSLTGAGGKTLKQRSELNKKIAQARNGLREEKQGLKDVKAERIKSNKVLKEATKNQADYSGVLDFVDSKTGGIIGKMSKFTKMIGSATKGFNLLRVAIIGTGIGALLIAVTSLTAAFTSNEKGQKKLKRIMAAIGVVVGNLVDIFAKLGNGIISVFEDPQQAVKDFANLIKEQITNRFNAILDTVGLLGSAIKKVFQRDFSGAVDDMKKGASRAVDAMTGVEDSFNKATDAVTGFIDEQVREANIMSGIMDKKEKAAKLERDLIVERSTLEGKIADLRLKARQKDEVSAADRKQALLDANALQQQLLDKETEALILKRDAIVAQNELSGSTTADLDAEAEAIAAVNAQIRKKADAERKLQREMNTINKEIATDKKQKEKETADAIESIRQALIITEDQQRKEKLRKIAEDYAEQIRLAEEFYGKESEQVLALRAAQKLAVDTQKAEFKEQDKEKQLTIDEEEKKKREEKLAEELEYNQRLADAEVALQEAKVNAVRGGLAILSKLAGDNKALATGILIVEKGLAIAEVVMNAQKAILAAKANLINTPVAIPGSPVPNPMYPIQAAATAKGILAAKIGAATSIATIVAQSIPGGGGGGAGGGRGVSIGGDAGGGGGAEESAPPAFNIVGASGANQLADAIGGQSQKPARAFVVSSDVSTAQELDRNIIEGASIG